MELETDKILTKAETRIAAGYVCGMIGKEIADAAGLSINTVTHHTQHIYDKAGIPRSTNSLVAWFLAKNYHLDLSDFKVKVYAAILLAIMGAQTVFEDFSPDVYLRSRRVEARRSSIRRRQEGDTLDITSI